MERLVLYRIPLLVSSLRAVPLHLTAPIVPLHLRPSQRGHDEEALPPSCLPIPILPHPVLRTRLVVR